ncbi:MAG: indolepyruvate ferredoxin oxidoreductase subunit alpha [Pseudomonadota bacterium]
MKATLPMEEFLLGNGAMARGLVEAGVQVVTAYPGTPSTEILPEVIRFVKMHGLSIYTEWSANEKVAFDVAYAASLTGKRAAVIMKQVGLNVAADSLMSAAYTGVVGGLIVFSADDPGPHSSQTEQDSRLFAHFAKVPAFDPSSPEEARNMVADAFALSEEFRIPVIIRPGIRVCHARQLIRFREPTRLDRPAAFVKDPERWAATPRYRYELHRELSQKLHEIGHRFEHLAEYNHHNLEYGQRYPFGLITGGVPYANLTDILEDEGLARTIPVLKLGAPQPFPRGLVDTFLSQVDRVLVVEETDEVIEMHLKNLFPIRGRSTGHVPREGELVPGRLHMILSEALRDLGLEPLPARDIRSLTDAVGRLDLPVRKPTLCPGCGHRSAFFAIRKALPKAIFTSDIGCYTLGVNLGVVDTCLAMGAGITLAAGFHQAYKQDGENQPVVATMGDSTFYHAGMVGLLSAVYNDARFVLVLLDNQITAMTGMQPTPGLGIRADGSRGRIIPLEDAVRGCGVTWLRVHDPNDVPGMIELVREAHKASCAEDGSVSVIIARRPCVVGYRNLDLPRIPVTITEDCNGCRICIRRFECPAFDFDEAREVVEINTALCVQCGVCVHTCPQGAIVPEGERNRGPQ